MLLYRFDAIIFIAGTLFALSHAAQTIELNATSAFLSIRSQLADLKSEQQQIKEELAKQGNLLESIVRKLDRYNPPGSSCAEVTSVFRHSGIFEILIPSYSRDSFKVACDAETRNGGWTILLRRLDGTVDFYRNWTEYKHGFGNLEGEFFLGLDKIHALTAYQSQELMFILEDFQGDVRYEKYDNFAIGDELDKYVLHTLGKAEGSAGDSMTEHLGQQFTTYDQDNDKYPKNCAKTHKGAWWYRACYRSHLTGTYNGLTPGKGLTWYHFRGDDYALKRAIMMIRPRN